MSTARSDLPRASNLAMDIHDAAELAQEVNKGASEHERSYSSRSRRLKALSMSRWASFFARVWRLS